MAQEEAEAVDGGRKSEGKSDWCEHQVSVALWSPDWWLLWEESIALSIGAMEEDLGSLHGRNFLPAACREEPRCQKWLKGQCLFFGM